LSDWRVGAIYNPYEVPFTYDAPLTPVRQRVNGRTIALSTIASGLVAATMLYRVLAMGGPLGGFENDQFVTLSQAQQIVMCDWPVRDFVALGKPLTLLLSAFGQVLLGRTLRAEAVLTSAFLGVCAAVLFVMGCRASGSILIALLVALMQIAMAPRFYNYPKLLAYAMAIPALWWYIDRPDRRRLAVLALVGVLAFLLRYDHGVYVGIAAILAVALAWRLDVRRMATDIALLGAMAFAHVAIAGYGCLQGKMPEPQMACEEHQSAAPSELLCRVHFQTETQTLDLAKVPQLFAFDSPVLVLVVEHNAPPAVTGTLLPARFAASSAPPPPLNILYSRFLI